MVTILERGLWAQLGFYFRFFKNLFVKISTPHLACLLTQPKFLALTSLSDRTRNCAFELVICHSANRCIGCPSHRTQLCIVRGHVEPPRANERQSAALRSFGSSDTKPRIGFQRNGLPQSHGTSSNQDQLDATIDKLCC